MKGRYGMKECARRVAQIDKAASVVRLEEARDEKKIGETTLERDLETPEAHLLAWASGLPSS